MLSGCVDELEEDTPSPSEYSTASVKSAAENVQYDELLRNIESYEGQAIHSTGEITQSFEDGDTFRLNISMERGDSGLWDSSKNAIVIWDGSRYIEDDLVEFWGVVEGITEYETVMGSTRTVPLISAVDMELIDETTTDYEGNIEITEVDSSWSENPFGADSGSITTVSATMENKGQLAFEPVVDLEIRHGEESSGASSSALGSSSDTGPNVVYSEEGAESLSLETAPGQTQDFNIIPAQEAEDPGEYTIEITLREEGFCSNT